MRPRRRADAIEGVGDIRHPVAQRLVHRVLQGPRARLHGNDLGAEHLHAEDVRLLPLDVDRAHIDDAVEAKARAGGGGGDAMLAGARLGDDALLAHAPREQDLPEHIVDLMRAGVVELVALEIDLGAFALARALPHIVGDALGEIERRGAPDIVLVEARELLVKRRIGLRLLVRRFKIEHERHQRFGDETPAENAEAAVFIRAGAEGIGNRLVHGGRPRSASLPPPQPSPATRERESDSALHRVSAMRLVGVPSPA